ncbi:MAG TPA: hypothetical protein VKV69_00225 [Actinomycetota bacterium]|nr:hypothetical protein [Actinomycetota bacterium]
MTKRRVKAILLFAACFLLVSVAAAAQTVTPTPTASATTSPEVRAGNEIVGLIILTGFAAAGYFVSKWIRRGRRPRPPGPWWGGFRNG